MKLLVSFSFLLMAAYSLTISFELRVSGRPDRSSVLAVAGFTKELAIEATNTNDNELVAFGRHFLANICYIFFPSNIRSDLT